MKEPHTPFVCLQERVVWRIVGYTLKEERSYMKTVRIGVVGCGGIGKYHARSLQKIGNVTIAAASDVNETARKEFEETFGVPRTFARYQDMMSRDIVDGVLVCVPTYLHADVVISAAQAVVHVFCEKPIARKLKDAHKMIAACEESGVVLMVGFVRRFDPCWGTAKGVVESGVLGKPLVWQDVQSGSGPDGISWFFDKDMGAGPLLDGMIHNVDFAHHMFGKAVSVTSGHTKFKSSTAVDTGSVWIEYESGNFMANFWSWGLPGGVSGLRGTSVIGPNGALLFPNSFAPELLDDCRETEAQGVFLLSGRDGKKEPVVYRKDDMFLEEMRHFADCVQHKRKPMVTGEEGIAALKVGLAVLGEETIE